MGKRTVLTKRSFPRVAKSKLRTVLFWKTSTEQWKSQHNLKPEQLGFADEIASVSSVGFYHGGDELYELEGVPGLWHEACLRAIE